MIPVALTALPGLATLELGTIALAANPEFFGYLGLMPGRSGLC